MESLHKAPTIIRANSPTIRMSYNDWADMFSPTECDISDGLDGFNGCLYPRTSVSVREAHLYSPNKAWTLIREPDKVVLVQGMRGINNRIGFFITDEPYNLLSRYEIEVGMN